MMNSGARTARTTAELGKPLFDALEHSKVQPIVRLASPLTRAAPWLAEALPWAGRAAGFAVRFVLEPLAFITLESEPQVVSPTRISWDESTRRLVDIVKRSAPQRMPVRLPSPSLPAPYAGQPNALPPSSQKPLLPDTVVATLDPKKPAATPPSQAAPGSKPAASRKSERSAPDDAVRDKIKEACAQIDDLLELKQKLEQLEARLEHGFDADLAREAADRRQGLELFDAEHIQQMEDFIEAVRTATTGRAADPLVRDFLGRARTLRHRFDTARLNMAEHRLANAQQSATTQRKLVPLRAQVTQLTQTLTTLDIDIENQEAILARDDEAFEAVLSRQVSASSFLGLSRAQVLRRALHQPMQNRELREASRIRYEHVIQRTRLIAQRDRVSQALESAKRQLSRLVALADTFEHQSMQWSERDVANRHRYLYRLIHAVDAFARAVRAWWR